MMKGDGFQPASTRDIRKVAPPHRAVATSDHER